MEAEKAETSVEKEKIGKTEGLIEDEKVRKKDSSVKEENGQTKPLAMEESARMTESAAERTNIDNRESTETTETTKATESAKRADTTKSAKRVENTRKSDEVETILQRAKVSLQNRELWLRRVLLMLSDMIVVTISGIFVLWARFEFQWGGQSKQNLKSHIYSISPCCCS